MDKTPEQVDPSAIGSDAPRTRKQYLVRRFADFIVRAFGLNAGSFIGTEIVQRIAPVHDIPTSFGRLVCRGGHGRLRWRAETFHTEEPQTIEWLDGLGPEDVLWDVGANVGLYSIYAAMKSKCRVIAFEPEAQNFSLLLENLALNSIQDRVTAANIPVAKTFSLGKLYVHALTKGGAYNQFYAQGSEESLRWGAETAPVSMLQFGASVDELAGEYGIIFPTYLKIDVDGREADIIAGAGKTLADSRLKSVLIELAPNDEDHMAVYDVMRRFGFELVSERSNWDSKSDRSREQERPQVNAIFGRSIQRARDHRPAASAAEKRE